MIDYNSIVGKKAYKKKGFFSGIVGIIKLNEYPNSNYVIVYKDGTKNCFNNLDEIELIK